MARDKPRSMFSFRKSKNFDDRSSRDEESKDSPSQSKDTKTRRTPERRESGRFQSAARILRSLARSRDDDTRPKEADTCNITRKNPQYHSEGKGLRKKHSQSKDLNPAATQKERSQSFCDKDASRRFSLKSQKSPEEASRHESPPEDAQHKSTASLTAASSRPLPQEPLHLNTQNIYEVVSEIRSDKAEDKLTNQQCSKDARNGRKLTKDSGYEAAAYCESDFTEANAPLAASETNVPSSDEHPSDATTSSPVNGATEVPLKRTSDDAIPAKVILQRSESLNRNTFVSRGPSAESLDVFADSLGNHSGGLVPARSTPVLSPSTHTPQQRKTVPDLPSRNHVILSSKSTPNLDAVDNDRMVTKKFSMYPFVHSCSSALQKTGNDASLGRYLESLEGRQESLNQNEYANHLRSSSYQMLHPRQLSTGSYHSRQPSNASNYSDDATICDEEAFMTNSNSYLPAGSSRRSMPRFESSDLSTHPDMWNDADISLASQSDQGYHSQMPSKTDEFSLPTRSSHQSEKSFVYTNSSPPPPPVRDASSLKYIRYGPGHEKFPSWPVPAGSASQVLPQLHNSSEANVSGLPDASLLELPHGCHRSHSWTEQSDYPKDTAGDYARPHNKKQFNPVFQKQLITAMDKCEKIPSDVFRSRHPEELLQSPNYAMLGNFAPPNLTYFPPYDREGRPINDKDYNIPSPPERDPGMGESNLSHVTVAQLEEHARRCDMDYGDYPQVTPLLDQLRQETYMWDDSSERDSGRGESESVGDSCRFSGRDSVATVVTNSSSASSSETLKWHGSLSDVSIMSGNSRDPRLDQNVVHSSRVQAPKRQNSESVLYYQKDARNKHNSKGCDPRASRDKQRHYKELEFHHSRSTRDVRWNREVERINDLNCVKKFPSYSYSQSLSQISEAPATESHEHNFPSKTKLNKKPSTGPSKPLSVADRISELERQSRVPKKDSNPKQRDISEPRDTRRSDQEQHDTPSHNMSRRGKELRKNVSEKDLRLNLTEHVRKTSFDASILNIQKPLSSRSFRSPNSSGLPSPRRDVDDSLCDSSRISGHEFDRTASSNMSYTYLDPEKKCMVPDSTLKIIQKQALMSFYERKTGKSANSSPTSPESKCSPYAKWSPTIRPDKGEKGMARIARVPDTEEMRAPCVPLRRSSVSSRKDLTSDAVRDDETLSSSSDLTSRSDPTPPSLPAKPHQIPLQASTCVPVDETINIDEFSKSCLENGGSVMSKSGCESSTFNRSTLSLQFVDQMPPSLPPLLDEAPPRPPDRPPKKPNLRSLFQGPDPSRHSMPNLHGPTEAAAKRIEESANELRNLSPARPYYYRKPPAPDPPASPSDDGSGPLQNIDPMSRVTPEPPLPPPPVVVDNEVILSDEPLPPPPSEVAPELVHLPVDIAHLERVYHKDSYMAQRKDLTTGFEGRYRRTHSPSAPPHRNTQQLPPRDAVQYSRNNQEPKQLNIQNNNNTVSGPSHGLSATNLKFTNGSAIDNQVSNNNHSDNDKLNEWPANHTTTTVSFTSEELRAFKARRITQERYSKRALPPAPPLRDVAGSVQSLASSSGSSNLSTPSDTSSMYSAPWRASLDSLHRPQSEMSDTPLRPISRAISMGEPLHRLEPSLEMSTESLSRSASVVEPLSSCVHSNTHNAKDSYSSPVNDARLSTSSDSPILHDGPITAHPATVTEENSLPSSPVSIMEAPKVTSTPRVSPISSPKCSFSLPKTSLSEHFSSNMSATPATSATSLCSSARGVSANTSPVQSPSSSFSVSQFGQTTRLGSTSNLVFSSSIGNLTFLSTGSTTCLSTKPSYARTLSLTGTSCTMASADIPVDEDLDRSNIVTLDYGRRTTAQERHYARLVKQFLSSLSADHPLHNVLAPEAGRCTGDFMRGVFLLELRKDLLCSSHSKHPDIDINNEQSFSDEATILAADSPAQEHTVDIKQTKDELIASVSDKQQILLAQQQCIKTEVEDNTALGETVSQVISRLAKTSEMDKYKTHAGEINKIASLLLGLSARLARAENSIASLKPDATESEKKTLESKREKLAEQFEEAKKIKTSIDKRALQVSQFLMQYLSEAQYADYDHHIKMKAKLLMDSKEIEDKLSRTEQQLKALKLVKL